MSKGRFFGRVVQLRSQVASTPALPFSELLSEDRMRSLLNELGIVCRKRIYTPWVTLWVFLSQVLSPDHSGAFPT